MRSAMRRAWPYVAVGTAILVATSALPSVHFWEAGGGGDMQLYQRFGERMLDGELPYGDFFVDYPPGSLPTFLLPAAVTESFRSYAIVFRIEQLVLFAVALAATVGALSLLGAGRARLLAAAVIIGGAPLLLGQVLFERYDPWSAALVALSLLAAAAGRLRWAGAVLALAALAKVYAIVLAPLLLLYVWRHRGGRETAAITGVAAAVAAVVAGPFAVVGFGGLGFTFYVHVTRPLQVESLGASILLVAHQLGAYTAKVVPGLSNDLDGGLPDALAFAGLAAFIVVYAVILLAFARGTMRTADLLAASVAAVVAFVAFGKVLSPQYMVWLIPLVPLAAETVWKPATSLLVAAVVATNLWFPERYGDLTHLSAVAWLVLARNAILVALVVLLTLNLVRTTRYYRSRR